MMFVCVFLAFPLIIHFGKKLIQLFSKKRYSISEIKEIILFEEENILEEKMIIRINSSRSKTYIFRKHKNQAEQFLQYALSKKPALIISR